MILKSLLTRRRWLRRILWLLLIVTFAFITKFILHLVLPRNFVAMGQKPKLQLAGGAFQVTCYCGLQQPKGIIILGSGDGGWSYWEENTAKHLLDTGYAVGGWDCRKFADSRNYDQAQLCAGFIAAVEAVRERTGAGDAVPVWYGGWSTGAEQSVAAAACANRLPQLVGLLLAAPGTRRRYGITSSDLLGGTPTGPDSFALADMVMPLKGLRVVQFAAGLDPLDDVDWIQRLASPYHLIHLPGTLHDMGGAGPEFQSKMDEAIDWTLQPTPATP